MVRLEGLQAAVVWCSHTTKRVLPCRRVWLFLCGVMNAVFQKVYFGLFGLRDQLKSLFRGRDSDPAAPYDPVPVHPPLADGQVHNRFAKSTDRCCQYFDAQQNLEGSLEDGTGSNPAPATTYYGLWIPPGDDNASTTEDHQLVYTDKTALLKVLKKFRGARFKTFQTLPEAQEFSMMPSDTICSPMRPVPQENNGPSSPVSGVFVEKSLYKSPRVPDLLKLRRIIETGDSKTFLDLVWNNPRYLVSSGDTPTILHEGFRYNALHVAAKGNKAELVRVILETIDNPTFLQKLYCYSKESEQSRKGRIMSLLDFYLNMPDKGGCETPLHFAVKFGFVDVVKVLLERPEMDKTVKNKYNEAPEEMICARVESASQKLKDTIKDLLQGQFYVPLLINDITLTPMIGEPCSSVEVLPHESFTSPKSPPESLKIKAYAGPMSPSQANHFKKQWLSPSSSNQKDARKYRKIRREDHDKGLERIGRNLAHDFSTSWSEYWNFLEMFTDLSTDEGLEQLEEHLKKQSLRHVMLESLRTISILQEKNGDSLQTPAANGFSEYSCNGSRCDSEEERCNKGFYGSTSCGDHSLNNNCSFSQQSIDKLIDILACEFSTKLILRDCDADTSTDEVLDVDMQNLSGLSESSNLILTTVDSLNQVVEAVEEGSLSISFIKSGSVNDTSTDWLHQMSPASSSKSGPLFSKSEKSPDKPVIVNIRSPTKTVCIPVIPARTPPLKKPVSVFLDGTKPTKTDIDVLRTLELVDIHSDKYPYTHRWKKLISSYEERTQNTWPSPAKIVRTSLLDSPTD